jgi:hypothetical protein
LHVGVIPQGVDRCKLKESLILGFEKLVRF